MPNQYSPTSMPIECICQQCGQSFIRYGPSHVGPYCSIPCSNLAKIQPVEPRFWSKVDKSGACWLWTAGVGTDGYGKFWIDGKTRHANTVAYELTYGPLPPGHVACHNCPDGDNPLCVNPAHLFAGTNLDNSRDMVEKGRSTKGDRHPSRLYPERVARGERHGSRTHPEALRRGGQHGNAKLTDETVLDIRARAAAGERHVALAREFGVTPTTVGYVVKRKVWTHI